MVEERSNVLEYSVRGQVVLKYSGQLAIVLALLTLLPLAFAIYEADWSLVLRYLLICGALFLFGAIFARLPTPDIIRTNEALTITALAFIVPSLLMVWPMMDAKLSFIDAIFESVSGVTTTGLSTLRHVAERPDSFLFLRAWMQWYGGLGFIVLSVALLLGNMAVARRLISPVESGESLMITARAYARRASIVYIILTLVGLILVWPLSADGFAALLHVLSAVSTGGFSKFDNSLAGLTSHSTAIAIIFISFLGSVSLTLYWKAYHAGWRNGVKSLLLDIEMRALILACIVAGGLLSLLAWWHGNAAPWYQGMMLGISAQTTTGFATQAISGMDAGSKLVMMVSMLIGGSVGSSAGGFKILRLLILIRAIQLLLHRAATPPHAVTEFRLGDQTLSSDEASHALLLILLYLIMVVFSWLPFVIAGYDPLDALFEVISASGTVGLSTGIVRPELEGLLKGILCFDMLAGRMEIVAMLIIIYPRNWFGRKEVTR